MGISFYITRRIPALLLMACFVVQMYAQGNSSSRRREFADFRKELQSEYDGFRKEINEEYAAFLSKAWEEYRLLPMKIPDETPKPLSPVLPQEEKESREVYVAAQEAAGSRADQASAEREVRERNILKAISAAPASAQVADSLQLDYFGAKLWLHYSNPPFFLPAITEQLVGNLWKEMASSGFSSLLAGMLRYKEEMQMNDWAYFLLAKEVAARFSACMDENGRTVFQHFLLVQSGYDVRLARIDRFLVLLVPIREEVYACPYLEMNGRTYYVISGKDFKSYKNIFTYQLPDKLIETPYLSLMMNRQLLLPMQPKAFSVKAAELEVSGEVNQNKIKFYREYPLCELSVYARAVPDAELMKQLQVPLAERLSGKPFAEALNLLLLWIQTGFDYQTDDGQFGYEKPFFVEETFYYPACDCEDRAVLFVCLVRRVLGKEVILLDYPGHVAAAVCMDEEEEVKGAYVRLDEKKYIICDPTYVNAKVGQLMPSCKSKRPKVIRL